MLGKSTAETLSSNLECNFYHLICFKAGLRNFLPMTTLIFTIDLPVFYQKPYRSYLLILIVIQYI